MVKRPKIILWSLDRTLFCLLSPVFVLLTSTEILSSFKMAHFIIHHSKFLISHLENFPHWDIFTPQYSFILHFSTFILAYDFPTGLLVNFDSINLLRRKVFNPKYNVERNHAIPKIN